MNNHITRVLSIKPFLFLWLSEVFSQIAMNMANFVLIIIAFELSHSNTAVSGIVLSFTLPAIVFGLFAGAYVDRVNKRSVLIVTNLLRAILLLLLAFFHASLVPIYILTFLTAFVTQFFIPAETPMIPLVVEKKLLLSANALFGMGIYGSVLIAYGLTGPFLVFLGQTQTFIVLSVLFLVAALFSHLIYTNKKMQKNNNGQVAIAQEVKRALSIIVKTKDVYYSIFLLTLSQILILILAVIGPGYANSVLQIEVNKFPLIFVTPAALGMVIAALVLAYFFHNHSKRLMTQVGVFLSSVSMLLLPYGGEVASKNIVSTINAFLPFATRINSLHVMIFLAFLLGISTALVFVPSNTILQERTSDELRGKVYGALNALVGIFSLLPILIVGGLSDIFGVSSVITGIGIGLFLLGIARLIIR